MKLWHRNFASPPSLTKLDCLAQVGDDGRCLQASQVGGFAQVLAVLKVHPDAGPLRLSQRIVRQIPDGILGAGKPIRLEPVLRTPVADARNKLKGNGSIKRGSHTTKLKPISAWYESQENGIWHDPNH